MKKTAVFFFGRTKNSGSHEQPHKRKHGMAFSTIIISWMRPKVKKGRFIMENTNKDQRVAEVMQLIDQLIQKEKDKNAEELEKLHKLNDAVLNLAMDMRSAVCFVNRYISAVLDTDIGDREAVDELLCSITMVSKILNQLLDETEKAENLVFGVSEGAIS